MALPIQNFHAVFAAGKRLPCTDEIVHSEAASEEKLARFKQSKV